MEPTAAAAEVVARRLGALFAATAVAGACAGPAAPPADGPRILRQWSVAATAPGAAPAARVVDSAAEWGALAREWRLPAAALPPAACDFTVARCLFVAVPAGVALRPTWGTEEGVDVLTLDPEATPASGPAVQAFALARRAAQLAVVYRPTAGGERVLWVDPGR